MSMMSAPPLVATPPPSGLGVARPAFVSSMASGVTSTPPIATLNPQQFGAAPNWSPETPPTPQSALLESRKPVAGQ